MFKKLRKIKLSKSTNTSFNNNYNNINEQNKNIIFCSPNFSPSKNNKQTINKNVERTSSCSNFYPKSYICNNCFNYTLASNNLMKDNLKNNKKQTLFNKFIQSDPHTVQATLNNIDNNYIQNKILNRENSSKIVYSIIENENNSNNNKKLNLIKNLENSLNTIPYNENPNTNTLEKYKKIEQIINSNPLLYKNLNNNRKAIDDYFNKNMFDVPVLEPNNEISEESKKNYLNFLKSQINNNLNNKRKEKEDELLFEKISNENNTNFMINNNNMENNKKNEMKNILNNFNDLLIQSKNKKKLNEKYEKSFFDKKFNTNINNKENDIKNNLIKNRKNLNNIYKNYINKNEENKMKNNYNNLKEKEKWNEYNKEFKKKCIHGNDMYKCILCNKFFKKNDLIEINNNLYNNNNKNINNNKNNNKENYNYNIYNNKYNNNNYIKNNNNNYYFYNM